MKNEKIYGPCIKWNGGECPVPKDTPVEVKFRDGDSQSGHPAYAYYWRHDGDGADIVEYRIVIEQPDLDAAEKLLRENGYTVTPPVKPLTFEDVVPTPDAFRKALRLAQRESLDRTGSGVVNWDQADAVMSDEARHLVECYIAAIDAAKGKKNGA